MENSHKKISEEGNLVISFTSVGKSVVYKEFSVQPNSTTIDLGVIYTKENAKELKGVEVVAQKPLVKTEIDKLAYNIEDDPDSNKQQYWKCYEKYLWLQ